MITLETRIGPGPERTAYGTTPTFEMMHFPAGEAHVKVINENAGKGQLTEIAYVTTPTADDLVMLGMWANAAWQRSSKTVAVMPYLPGARQDRGNPFGADVYSRLINSLALDQVIAMDVHSEVMEGLVGNLTTVSPAHLIRHSIVGRADRDFPQSYDAIIAPDEGAAARAKRVADICHLPLVQAYKHRDESTGKLSGFTCDPVDLSKRYLIVDDICDGGGTFMGLANATGLDRDHLDLFVTHGVFSGKAAEILPEAFGKVYTTDSYKPQTDLPNLTIIPATPYLIGAIK